MNPYTEIFDKRPLTYLTPGKNDEDLISWYSDAVYYTDKSEYSFPQVTGNLVSGSSLIDVLEDFAFTQDSSFDWVAAQNTGLISIHKFSGAGQLEAQFGGTNPVLHWNSHTHLSNTDMICFYIGQSGIEGRSSFDNFSNKFDVLVNNNVTSLKGVQEIPENTGQINIFGIHDNFSGFILSKWGN